MKKLLKKPFNVLGCLALLLGALAVHPASTIFTQQPKCPDELL
ncbi:MAG: AgrD family cyclic lactone autoinducer peptide [Solirubrobacterales bacterium]